MSRTRMPQAVALFIALTILAGTPAHAQFGGLVKKAKQAAENKVEKKVDQKVNSNLKPSSTFGDELTEASFGDLSRGLNAELGKVERRDALHADADSTHGRLERLQDQYRAEFKSYEDKQTANRDCRHAAEEALGAKHEQEMQGKIAAQLSPAFQKEMGEMQNRNQKALDKANKSGDKAAIAKATEDLQRGMMKLLGFDLAADSATIDRQCPRPAETARVREAKALTARENELRVQIRAVDAELTSAGTAASGMTSEIYALAKERVLNWSQEAFDNGSQIQEFGRDERKMFEANKQQIKRLRKVLV